MIYYLNWDNKYKKSRIDGHTGIKKGRQLLAELKAEMEALEVFESLSLEKQEQRIANPKDTDSDDYNLFDFELDDEFDMDFGEDDEKEEDDINQNHPVLDDILEGNTPKPHHSSFKYGETPQPTQYSTPKPPEIEPLTPLIPKPSGYRTSNPPTPKPLTPLSTAFSQLPVSMKKRKRPVYPVVQTATGLRSRRKYTSWK